MTHFENSVASDIHNNTTHIEISDELCADNNIETTVNDIEVFESKILVDLKGVTDSLSTLLSLENICKEFLDSDLFCRDKRGEMETMSICSDKSKTMV